MAVMIEPTVQWVTAAPLWPEVMNTTDTSISQALFTPMILRFASDSFVDEFLAVLNTAPERLGERRVQPETRREPLPVPEPLEKVPLPGARPKRQSRPTILGTGSTRKPITGAATGSLKLYQPVYQRYYLVSACLVCRVPGMPDRMIDTFHEERATFVVRRVQPHSAYGTPDTGNPDSYDEFCVSLRLLRAIVGNRL